MISPFKQIKKGSKKYLVLSKEVKKLMSESVDSESEHELDKDIDAICIHMMAKASDTMKRYFLKSLIDGDVLTFMTDDFRLDNDFKAEDLKQVLKRLDKYIPDDME